MRDAQAGFFGPGARELAEGRGNVGSRGKGGARNHTWRQAWGGLPKVQILGIFRPGLSERSPRRSEREGRLGVAYRKSPESLRILLLTQAIRTYTCARTRVNYLFIYIIRF